MIIRNSGLRHRALRLVPERWRGYGIEHARVGDNITDWVRVVRNRRDWRTCIRLPATDNNAWRMQRVIRCAGVLAWIEFEQTVSAEPPGIVWCLSGSREALVNATRIVEGFEPSAVVVKAIHTPE